MQKKFLKLEKPCKELWENMVAKENGNYCHLCAKNVIDFTTLNQYEIAEKMKLANGNICARVSTEQLNIPLFEIEDSVIPSNSFPYSKIAAGLILASSLITSQPILAKDSKVENRIEQTLTTKSIFKPKKYSQKKATNTHFTIINGKVLSEKENLPVFNASISFVTSQKIWVTHSLKDGSFSLKIPSELIDDDNVIRISYEKAEYKSKEEYFFGFETADLVLTKKEINTTISITATPVELILGGISSYPQESREPLVIKNGIQIPYKIFIKDRKDWNSYIYFNSKSGIALFGQKAKYGLYLSVDKVEFD